MVETQTDRIENMLKAISLQLGIQLTGSQVDLEELMNRIQENYTKEKIESG